MLIETLELTLSDVSLGDLNEFALMTLFANLQAHRLTLGKNTSLRDIVDISGHSLYPAYYWTHLKIPPGGLRRYHLWKKIAIGVEVYSSGPLLESTYVICMPGELVQPLELKNIDTFPHMHANSMFIVEGQGREAQISVPRADLVADLPKLTTPPETIHRFHNLRVQGSLVPDFAGDFRPKYPIVYRLLPGRDVAPGHNMMFAKFIEIMDYAEYMLLTEHIWPAFPLPLLECLMPLERETYYFDNCQAHTSVRIDIQGQIVPCNANYHGSSTDMVSVGILTFVIEVYQEGVNNLLVLSNVKKLMIVPSTWLSLLREAERLVKRYTSSSNINSL